MIVHLVIQHTLFSATNNQLYAILTTVVVVLEVLFGMLPRFSSKHFVFKILMGYAIFVIVRKLGCILLLTSKYCRFSNQAMSNFDYFANFSLTIMKKLQTPLSKPTTSVTPSKHSIKHS